ncbi:MAG: hypothetical protein JST19_01520 [Bacteroidetes bacterium]|nr:hypothetical protein [Bacteroidota bacterium]
MKKLCLLALACLLFVQLKAQNGVIFKVKYLPNKTYQSSVKLNMKLHAMISGDQQVLDKLKSQGITQPVNVSIDMGFSGVMKTGSPNADNSYPLHLDFKIDNLSVMLGDKQVPVPPKVSETDFKAVGSIDANGKIQIDSAAGKKANDTTQKKMQQMMDMVQKKISFPDRALKPGDSFTQTMPLNIPIDKGGVNNMQMNFSITYTLTSISGDNANFDMTPNFNLTLAVKGANITITGAGAGKMVYSIGNNFPVSKDGNFNMKLKVNSDKVNVDGDATITTSFTTAIN